MAGYLKTVAGAMNRVGVFERVKGFKFFFGAKTYSTPNWITTLLGKISFGVSLPLIWNRTQSETTMQATTTSGSAGAEVVIDVSGQKSPLSSFPDGNASLSNWTKFCAVCAVSAAVGAGLTWLYLKKKTERGGGGGGVTVNGGVYIGCCCGRNAVGPSNAGSD